MHGLTVAEAAAATGWSPRMLRYLEKARLVVPARTPSGYRLYGDRELSQLRALSDLRARHGVGITDMAFAARLRREPALRVDVDAWLVRSELAWVEWEQAKHERLLAA